MIVNDLDRKPLISCQIYEISIKFSTTRMIYKEVSSTKSLNMNWKPIVDLFLWTPCTKLLIVCTTTVYIQLYSCKRRGNLICIFVM